MIALLTYSIYMYDKVTYTIATLPPPPSRQVLNLLHFLIKFGYYSSDDIRTLLPPLLRLLNGNLDKPFPPDNDKKGSSTGGG